MTKRIRWIIAAALAASLAGSAAGAGPTDAQAAQPALPDKALVRFGEARLFHGTPVMCLSFSADGREIVAAGGRGPTGSEVSIWSAATGSLVRTMAGPTNGVSGMSLSGDGKAIVLAGTDRSVQFVSFPGGKPLRDAKSPLFRGNWVALSPNGSQMAMSDGTKLTVVNLATSKLVMTVMKGTGGAFSRDGRYLAVVSMRDLNFGIELWDASAGVRIRPFDGADRQRFCVPAFSPNGKLIVAANIYGGTKEIHVWDTLTGKAVNKLPGSSGSVATVAFSPDGKWLAVADRTQFLRVLDFEAGKALPKISAGLSRIYAVAFSPDGRRLAGGASNGQIHVWETGKFSELLARTSHGGALVSVGAGDSGRIVATGGHDGKALLWDGRTGRELHRLQTEDGRASVVAVSRDGELAASCGNSETVRIWRTDTGKQLRSASVAHGTAMWVAFRPGGRELIAMGTDGAICRIDVDTGKAVSLVPGGGSPTLRISMAGNSSVAAGYYRNTVTAWELRGGRKLGVFTMPGTSNLYGLAVSPGGRLLAGDAGQRVTIVELDSGRLVRYITLPNRRASTSQATFSPDGRVLALAGADWTVGLWSVRTGRRLGQLLGHRGRVTSMIFMPDGERLLTGSMDGTAIMWDVRDILARKTPATAPAKQADLLEAWQALAEQDAEAADGAFYLLAEGGSATVRVMAERIAAVEGPDPARISKLVSDLGHEQYGVRKQATEALAQLGPVVEPALRLAESSSDVEEVRLRARQLLAVLDNPLDRTGDALRQLRAALVLEEIATPEAVALLKKLAAGSPGANLTRRATEALERIQTRSPAARPSKDGR